MLLGSQLEIGQHPPQLPFTWALELGATGGLYVLGKVGMINSRQGRQVTWSVTAPPPPAGWLWAGVGVGAPSVILCGAKDIRDHMAF